MKTIAIDLDSTIINTTKILINLNNKYTNKKLKFDKNHTWKMRPIVSNDDELKELFMFFDHKEFYNNVITFDNAINIINELSKKYNVIICSKHMNSRKPLTKKWVENTFKNVQLIFTDSFDKSEIYNNSWIILDDRLDALDSCTNESTYKFCYGNYDWNKESKYERILSWNDFNNKINEFEKKKER